MDTAHGQDAAPAAEDDHVSATDQAHSPRPDDPATQADGAADDVPAAGSRPRVRRVGVLIAVAAAIYALDIASKAIVAATMHYGQPIRVLGPALQLNYTRNPGAAFSVGEAYTIIFTAIAVGVIVVILRLSRKLFSLPWAIALGLLLGGALGNLTDRITRAPGIFRGWVVDFIQLPHWPIFNLADSAICVGGALMVLLAFRGLHPDGTDERAVQQANARTNAGDDRPENSGPGDETDGSAA
ncbi:MAG TPA: signal peptidase II [Actinocrinis sp.]|nr:signal peptidase II [Actinocrinis sp.]